MRPPVLLFFTIALSLSVIAYGDSKPQRRDAVPMGDLSVFPRSNTSDEISLNMNSRRALDDHPLVRRSGNRNIQLTLDRGRFTTTVRFNGKSVSGVVLDTSSRTTWALLEVKSSSAAEGSTIDFNFMDLELHGDATEGTVELEEGLTSHMEFAAVSPGQELNGYAGGLGLDRSPISWQNFVDNHIPRIFAFYNSGNKAEFDFGQIDPTYYHQIEWHLVDPSLNTWTLNNARIKVHKEFGILKDVSTTIRTGARYIYGSTDIVNELYGKLKGARQFKGIWMLPCDRPPVVSFSWESGRDFCIQNFFLSGVASVGGKRYCQGAILPHSTLPPNTFDLGAIFLYGKYVAFQSKTPEQVGFLSIAESPVASPQN